MENNIKKDFIWNSIGSTIYACTSLFFLIIVTRLNGVNEAGIFAFAFTFSLLSQVIGNYAGRSYQVTNIEKKITDSDFVYSRIITCFIMLLFMSLFLIIKDYSFFKSIIIILLILFRIIESFGEVLYGIIQKNNKLYQVGISLFLKGILSIVIFFLIDYYSKNLILSIIGICIINVIILILYDKKNIISCKFRLNKINITSIKKILIGGFFVFVFTFLIQYVLNASKYSIDNYMIDKFQTIYGIILMPATVLGLCSQFLIQPFLTNISILLKDDKIKKFSLLIFKISICIFVIGLVGEVICYFIGIPILELIYNINLSDYKDSLMLIVGGSVFYGISYVLSTCLIAMRKNFVQALIYAFISLFTFILSNRLVQLNGVMGASLSYFITMIFLFILYLLYFIYNISKLNNSKKKV